MNSAIVTRPAPLASKCLKAILVFGYFFSKQDAKLRSTFSQPLLSGPFFPSALVRTFCFTPSGGKASCAGTSCCPGGFPDAIRRTRRRGRRASSCPRATRLIGRIGDPPILSTSSPSAAPCFAPQELGSTLLMTSRPEGEEINFMPRWPTVTGTSNTWVASPPSSAGAFSTITGSGWSSLDLDFALLTVGLLPVTLPHKSSCSWRRVSCAWRSSLSSLWWECSASTKLGTDIDSFWTSRTLLPDPTDSTVRLLPDPTTRSSSGSSPAASWCESTTPEALKFADPPLLPTVRSPASCPHNSGSIPAEISFSWLCLKLLLELVRSQPL
mmetsp:Transcript_87887/g.221197  ORF Transcript_87887/g.221197 Transcript_87887/m.221197 type:complete len:326 (-) Transcript_87887:576-1553(-)